MSLSLGLFTLLNAWCISLFITLPFCIQKEENPTPEHYAAAPKAIRWKKVLFINTIVSVTITLVLALVINSGIIQIRDQG